MLPPNRFFEKISITQRQAVLAVLAIYFLGTLLLVPFELMTALPANPLHTAGGLGAAIIFGSAWILYFRYNWQTTRYLAAVACSILVASFLPEPFVSEYAPMVIVIPIVLALILTEPFWVVVTGIMTIGILLVRANGSGVYAQPMTLILYLMILSGLLIRRLIAETSLRQIKQAQESTKQGEIRFRRLMENSSDQVSVLDATGRLLYESPLSNPILGYRFEEHLGKTIFELIHPDDQERVKAILAKLSQDPSLHPCERFRLLHSNGTWRWIEVVAKNLLDEPSIGGIVINYHDVTERVQAEEQIQRQLKRLRGLRLIDIAISSSLDLNVTLDVVLQQAISLLEIDAATVLLVNRDTQMVEYAASRGFQSHFLHYTGLPFGIAYAGRAIVERKVIHIANLMDTGSELAKALQSANESFAEYYSAPLIVKGEVKGVLEIYRRSGSHEDAKALDFLETLAGQAAIAIDNAQLFESLQKANSQLERRVSERTAELNKSNAELERANRAKDEFLANMSHELRTPLNSILGLSESLLEQRRDTLTDHQEKSLQMIESSGRHLLELINDILDLSKIEAGMFDFYPETIILEDFCRSCLAFVKSQAVKKSITITYIPEPFVVKIFADPRRLKQALVNLLINAVKFTSENGHVILRVNAAPEHDIIQFAVIDNGIGIAREDLQRLFQPFVQLDSSLTRQYEGTGLGLSLVQKLTDLHGGSISVESKVGEGSQFTINIPCVQEKMLKPEVFHLDTRFQSTNVAGNNDEWLRMTARRGAILLAEDNVANVLTMGEYFENHGYEIVVAHNGLEAIEKAEEMSPDIILMDIQMPVVNGLEAIARLRSNHRFAATPIVALTALAMPGDRERCLLAGASEYMSKPVKLNSLKQIIVDLLQTQRMNSGAK